MANDVSNNPLEIKYHRRLDRTPEKMFDSNRESDKIRICQVRKLTEKARRKITDLQDGIDDRDEVIEQERELRKAAEERLRAHLTDPYQNPEVNQELRERLPRANKTDPLEETYCKNDIDQIPEKEVTDEIEKIKSADTQRVQSSQDFNIEEIEAQIIQPDTSSYPQDSSKNMQDSGAVFKKSVTMDMNKSTTENHQPGILSSTAQFQTPNMSCPTSSGQPGGQYGSYVPSFMSPQMYFNSSYPAPFMNPTALYSYNMVSPRAPLRNVGSDPQNPGIQSHPVSPQKVPSLNAESHNSSVGADMDVSLNVDDLKSSPQGNENITGMSRSGSSNPVPGNLDSQNGATSQTLGLSSHLHLNQPVMNSSIPSHPVLPSLYSHGYSPLASSGIGTDQSKQISFLLSELDSVKSQNKKLAEKLVHAERELEISHIRTKTEDVDMATLNEAAAAAGLVQEVQAAQKKKEESMMGRIKVATEEKDEALSRLKVMERRLDEGYSDLADLSDLEDFDEDEVQEGIENLISQIDPFYVSNRKYSSLLKKLENIKSRQREITMESMQTLIEERDLALAKARRMEEELNREQSRDIGDHHLRAQMAVMKQERNMALEQNRQLKDEIQTIRIYYSLHKSLAQESSSSSNAKNTLNTHNTNLTDNSQKESNVLLDELRTMKIERDQMEMEMEKMRHKLDESSRNTEKLNSLVAALRRKLKSDIAKAEAAANGK